MSTNKESSVLKKSKHFPYTNKRTGKRSSVSLNPMLWGLIKNNEQVLFGVTGSHHNNASSWLNSEINRLLELHAEDGGNLKVGALSDLIKDAMYMLLVEGDLIDGYIESPSDRLYRGKRVDKSCLYFS